MRLEGRLGRGDGTVAERRTVTETWWVGSARCVLGEWLWVC